MTPRQGVETGIRESPQTQNPDSLPLNQGVSGSQYAATWDSNSAPKLALLGGRGTVDLYQGNFDY